jgi:hypothetical protein
MYRFLFIIIKKETERLDLTEMAPNGKKITLACQREKNIVG